MLWLWLRPWIYLVVAVALIVLVVVMVLKSPQYVFGDLAAWPLPAAAWGSFGQWVGALGTGGGALIAATVYRHNSQRDREEQARLVRVVTTSRPIIGPQSLYPEPFTVIVFNYSDKPIFDLRSGIDKRVLSEVILPMLDMRMGEGAISDEELDAHLAGIREASTDVFFPFPPDFKLDPGFGYRFAYSQPITQYHKPWVSFTDAAGEHWSYSIATSFDDVPILRHAPKDGWSKMMRSLRITQYIYSPRSVIKRTREKRRIRKWLRANHNGL